ncbi:ABC transporter substrate-binding protein [Planomonospora venezuelensis]|uniref:Iron complex transport system substrate-binding protein n=1 Tax=Planomonospora venezuelensis TaxID=1999 RepID=A0A841CWC2_PLAVE|nr:ABC transporter substrate-binding protein [Planomonospora venezuelensis]MBB5961609.1 iron complex transport system substrate-binding protein [Planomonospora venezuelensis]GIM98755.1 ABC transporter substrate-binding protein [Planomonospora venezuelensis]
MSLPVLSRRGFLAAGLGTALLTLTACGEGAEKAPEGAASPSAPAAGPWSFTDDRGKKIDLPKRPERIVAQIGAAAVLWDFGVRPIAVFGPHKLKDGSKDPQIGDVDLAKVETLGNVWDEFNVEKYISLQPELLISGMYNGDTLWYVPEKSTATIEQVAPTLGVKLFGRSIPNLIAKYGEVAASLGADLNAPAVTGAKAGFEAASKALPTPEARQLKIMVMAGGPEALWIAHFKDHIDVGYMKELGLDVVVPDKVEKTGYWETLSWENADKYDADVILVDARAQSMQVPEMMKKPTFAQLPAVKAGQVYPWRAEQRYSYQGYTAMLEELAANLAKAKKLDG